MTRFFLLGIIMMVIGTAGFSEAGYRTYTDKDKGVAFLYPDTASVKAGAEDVTVTLAGQPNDMNQPVAAIAFGIINPEDEDVGALDEKGFLQYTANMDESVSLVSGPVTVKAAGMEWQQAEFSVFEGRMRLVVRKIGDAFFGIVFLAIPAELADEYDDAFSVFLDSLELDVDQWLAAVGKKK